MNHFNCRLSYPQILAVKFFPYSVTLRVLRIVSYDRMHIINNKIRFDGMSVEEAMSTTFAHSNILHLATYLGQPLTTGSSNPDHAKTEIMNLESGEWESGPDYPFHSM